MPTLTHLIALPSLLWPALLVTLTGCSGCGTTNASQGGSPSQAAAERFSRSPSDTLTYRGFTFAHEAYDGKRGYGGASVGPSMDSLASLHVNAVALVPYTFMREPDVPVELPIAERLGMETDTALVHSTREAHARGWTVMLKPQIWLGGGHWPGDVAFDTNEEWEAWFQHYSDWMLHYARFAERHNIAALCIGTELGQTTLQHPEFWRKLIKDVREVYSGKLTYAANWGEEFEGITFWSELDAVGCNGYYPLSQNPQATDAELYEGAKQWLMKANNIAAGAQRPLWLTEIGYRSVRASWIEPHAAPNRREVSESCQRRSFEALFAATAEAPLLEGMFIWKWPSYLGHGYQPLGKLQDSERAQEGEGPKGYAPGGKEAAEVVKRYYAGARL